jgi:NADH:ubiquinone oxidoreductase subunit K
MALSFFMVGFGLLLIRQGVFESLIAVGICLKAVCLAAFIISKFSGQHLGVMTGVGFSALSQLTIIHLAGIALSLRNLRSGGPVDFEARSELKN